MSTLTLWCLSLPDWQERWKLKQEQSRVEAQQSVMENERRMWAEQQARERQSLDRARVGPSFHPLSAKLDNWCRQMNDSLTD